MPRRDSSRNLPRTGFPLVAVILVVCEMHLKGGSVIAAKLVHSPMIFEALKRQVAERELDVTPRRHSSSEDDLSDAPRNTRGIRLQATVLKNRSLGPKEVPPSAIFQPAQSSQPLQ